MPVSHELRCLFVHVPRTGGTSIEAALGMAGDVDVEDEDRLFGRIRSEKYRQLGFGSDFFQHLTLREIRSLESATRSRDYFSFAVVRNPWERAVSVYARLVAGEAGVLAQQLGVADPSSLSFRGFLDLAADCPHPHLKPQLDFLVDDAGVVAVDLVCRFEQLDVCFDEVRRRLNRLDLALPHVNRSVHRHYSSYYDRATRDQVAKIYARDIEAFGYSFEAVTAADDEAGDGFVYAAVGEKYVTEARKSARSLRAVDPDARITLLTDALVSEHEFDRVVVRPVEKIALGKAPDDWGEAALLAFAWRAAHMYAASPYARTIYVDSDTHFLKDFGPVFDMLKHFDFCMAAAPMDGAEPLAGGQRLTGCTPLNCGLIGFRRSEQVEQHFRAWHRIYVDKIMRGALLEGQFEGDQASFIQAWLETESKIYTLPSVWNFRVPFPATLNGPVRLVHGRHDDYARLGRRLNAVTTIRSWCPTSERCHVAGAGVWARARRWLFGGGR